MTILFNGNNKILRVSKNLPKLKQLLLAAIILLKNTTYSLSMLSMNLKLYNA